MPAVGPDHNVGIFRDGPAALRSTLDADDATVFDNHVLDGEALTDLGAGLGRGVDEQFVEDRPPGTIGNGILVVPGAPEIVNAPKSKA